MKILKKITNGILLILIGLLHTSLAVSPEGGGKQFLNAAKSYFFNISAYVDEFPLKAGQPGLHMMPFCCSF